MNGIIKGLLLRIRLNAVVVLVSRIFLILLIIAGVFGRLMVQLIVPGKFALSNVEQVRMN
jgi:hypothetical protein